MLRKFVVFALLVEASLTDAPFVQQEPDVVRLVFILDSFAKFRIRLDVPSVRPLLHALNLLHLGSPLSVNVPLNKLLYGIRVRNRVFHRGCLFSRRTPYRKQFERLDTRFFRYVFSVQNFPRNVRITGRLFVRPKHSKSRSTVDTGIDDLCPINSIVDGQVQQDSRTGRKSLLFRHSVVRPVNVHARLQPLLDWSYLGTGDATPSGLPHNVMNLFTNL